MACFSGLGNKLIKCEGYRAVYEVRTYGSVRGMRHKPHPTRCYYLDFLFLGFATSTVFDSFSLRFSFNDKAGFFLSFLDIFTT